MKQLSGFLFLLFSVILLSVNAFSDHRKEASHMKEFLRHGRPAKNVADLDDNFLLNLKEYIKKILPEREHQKKEH